MKIITLLSFVLCLFLLMAIFFFILDHFLNFFIGRKLLFKNKEVEIKSEYSNIEHHTPRRYTPNYNQKIPFNIFQTSEFSIIPTTMKVVIDSNIKLNPEYNHYFFNNLERIKFISEHFPEDVLSAYNSLVPGAFRADLFRLCVLYIEGGFYFDSGVYFIEPLRNIIKEDTPLLLCEDSNTHFLLRNGKKPIYNGFFGSVKGHPLFLENINLIVKNVKEKFYGNDTLGVTGPVSLLNSYEKIYGKFGGWKNSPEEILFLKADINFWYAKHNLMTIRDKNENILASTKYINYKKEQRRHISKKGYGSLFHERKMYSTDSNPIMEKPQNLDTSPYPSPKKVKVIPDIYYIRKNPQKDLFVPKKVIPLSVECERTLEFEKYFYPKNDKEASLIDYYIKNHPEKEHYITKEIKEVTISQEEILKSIQTH